MMTGFRRGIHHMTQGAFPASFPEDAPQTGPTLIQRSDAEIERMKHIVEAAAMGAPGISDPHAEGARQMLAFLMGNLDFTSLVLNWRDDPELHVPTDAPLGPRQGEW